MSDAGFWSNEKASTAVVKNLQSLKTTVEPWEGIFHKYRELKELADIIKEEDKEFILGLLDNIKTLSQDLERIEFRAVFSSPLDKNSAILSINAGAGGTEACDWAAMLFRMYSRFAEKHGWSLKTIDVLPGEEAGIKNITALIEGEYAFGYLKAERGVHRLVRISPFDANKRRHTSFASVDFIPEAEEETGVKIEDKDLRIDVFRSAGAGGQSVNTTDSAVRITHTPTGIVAQCQNERSQYQNKQMAMKILKARLFEFQRQKKEEELVRQYATDKKKIEWGSQIRSYVMHPYNMVKDHRTDYETGDTSRVMDGDIDDFIESYLKSQRPKKTES